MAPVKSRVQISSVSLGERRCCHVDCLLMFNTEEYYTVIVPAGTVLGSLMCHSLNIQMRRQEEGKPSLS